MATYDPKTRNERFQKTLDQNARGEYGGFHRPSQAWWHRPKPADYLAPDCPQRLAVESAFLAAVAAGPVDRHALYHSFGELPPPYGLYYHDYLDVVLTGLITSGRLVADETDLRLSRTLFSTPPQTENER
jgi:hypothetical protein